MSPSSSTTRIGVRGGAAGGAAMEPGGWNGTVPPAREGLDGLRRKLDGGGAVVAGVLSGTSADAIDGALVRRAAEAPELLTFEALPFEPALGRRVRRVLDGEPTLLRETALLSRDLGRAFGRAAREVAGRAGLEPDLVGSHGQTVWHHDGVDP